MLAIVKQKSANRVIFPATIFKKSDQKTTSKLSKNLSTPQTIQKNKELIKELAKSIEITEEFKDKDLDYIINEAKKGYFAENEK